MKQYYTEPRLNNAAHFLSTAAPDMIDAIIELVSREGYSLNRILRSGEASLPRFNAIFSSAYMPEEVMPRVMLGFSVIALSQIRTPKFGNEEYAKILRECFSLPDEIVNKMIQKIETEDIISGAAGLSNTLRNWTNWGLKAFGTDEENLVDQTQDFDSDFLHELMLLGDAIDSLNLRVTLMAGQARISNSMGIMKAATEAESGDPLDGDAMGEAVGDLISRATARALPSSFFGGYKNIAKAGASATAAEVQTAKTVQAEHESGRNKTALGSLLSNISQGKVLPSVLTGIALGPMAYLLKSLISKKKEFGDPLGDELTAAIASGNLDDALMQMLAGAANGDVFTSGDPELDAMIDQECEECGDPLIGGLLANFRKKIAYRRQQRLARMQGRKAARMTRQSNRLAAREMRKSTRQTARQERLESRLSDRSPEAPGGADQAEYTDISPREADTPMMDEYTVPPGTVSPDGTINFGNFDAPPADYASEDGDYES